MIRIAFLDHTAKWSGGEVALYNILTHLDEDINPLVILAEEGELADRLREEGVDVRVIPLSEKVRHRNRNALNWGSVAAAISMFTYGAKLARVLKKEHVVCVHTNSLKSALYGAIAAKLASIPVIWHIRDHINPPYMKPIVARAVKLLSRFVPNGVIANSESTLNALSLPQTKKTLVVYSSFAKEIGRKESGRKDKDDFIILLVGRLAHWKGQHVLLEAAKSFLPNKNVKFWLAGDALFGEENYKQALQLQIASDELTNVTMLGHVNHVLELMHQVDLLVHTSITPEPFGQVIVEGMAVGLPVIASNEGGPVEIVVHNKTGLLITPRDPEQLRHSIQWMLDHPEERKLMSENAMKRVESHFTIDRTIKKITTYYQRVIVKA